MTRYRALTEGASPGGGYGAVFTASLAEKAIIPQNGEAYLDSLYVSITATTAVGLPTLQTVGSILQPLVVKAGEPRIQMRGSDLLALSMAWYGTTPPTYVEDVGDTTIISGVRIPAQIKIKTNENYAFFASRVGQTNLTVETLLVGSRWLSTAPNMGRLDMREIPYTTPGATGITTAYQKLPKLGNLKGLLVFCNTPQDEEGTAPSIQRIFLDSPSTRLVSANWQEARSGIVTNAQNGAITNSYLETFCNQYGFLDFRDEPIDLVGQDVALTVDVQATSDSVRFIPIIEMPQ